jgi:hypothetical protein
MGTYQAFGSHLTRACLTVSLQAQTIRVTAEACP